MRLETLPAPVPGPGQILIRVAAFGVTRGDARIRALDVPRGFGLPLRLAFGLTRPRRPIQGREFAGEVAGLGAGLGAGGTGFRMGDRVFGITDGMSLGAGAEYLCVSADRLVFPLPDGMDMAEAAGFLFGGLTAMDFLVDQARTQRGERVLIVGATGAVGSAAVQCARYLGARVTALASRDNLELARDLGAQVASDYRRPWPQGPFDIILDIAGVVTPARARPLLAPGGRLARITCDALGQIAGALWPRRGGMRVCVGTVRETRAAVERLLAVHRAGGYVPLVLPPFPMERIVDAHRLAQSGRKQGNVVVALRPLEPPRPRA